MQFVNRLVANLPLLLVFASAASAPVGPVVSNVPVFAGEIFFAAQSTSLDVRPLEELVLKLDRLAQAHAVCGLIAGHANPGEGAVETQRAACF